MIYKHITQAWQPKTFSTPELQAKHEARAKECGDCEFAQYTGPYSKPEGGVGLLFRCSICRGSLHQKTRRSGESCPVGKW
ncbi:MAG: hypothetical protein AB8B69_16970 [Chitinophagales bacterium]